MIHEIEKYVASWKPEAEGGAYGIIVLFYVVLDDGIKRTSLRFDAASEFAAVLTILATSEKAAIDTRSRAILSGLEEIEEE